MNKNKKLIVLSWDVNNGYIYPTKKDRRGGYEHVFALAESIGFELENHVKHLM
ncbi:hypothetical protein PaecuDRAFT_4365 [Paenibacillus curdlanolyticus YK9]|uniref:Uncharacterized protein n=1 Tax=Paenibacillus curdlanolyticus YK9 TaxID=717606 RepID=E0IFC4_9BACL|nr:hypothetical protein [Paenibacillus curdlanolyticus]EFM08900.1 hypothetical protein PaecuDRAFT_4365 [Paenibacillus curdlanolyticus YK9]